jgi:hypothetical protein
MHHHLHVLQWILEQSHRSSHQAAMLVNPKALTHHRLSQLSQLALPSRHQQLQARGLPLLAAPAAAKHLAILLRVLLRPSLAQRNTLKQRKQKCSI